MKLSNNIRVYVAGLTMALMLVTPYTMSAQDFSSKYALTTKILLNEQKAQTEQPAAAPERTRNQRIKLKQQRLIAAPDTVGDVVYVSCFIHLIDPSDLSAVEALGVEVEDTFEELDFITARVPVDRMEDLAAIDNVTKIKVAKNMRLTTDAARQQTRAYDLLAVSQTAVDLGVTSKYDGTGVVLGVIDMGIDFQHIAFKDKNGNTRIKRAYVYTGSGRGSEYTSVSGLTTDANSEDHGTHTASTAGGSSVIVNKISSSNFTVTVTDNHANATYGGMAPGADLYLAGINGLGETYIISALNKMVAYADAQNKPLVVSNSWGSYWGPHNGTGEFADVVDQHFGDGHPNHIILIASSNEAGRAGAGETGGMFVQKTAATQTDPLGTVIQTEGYGGDVYSGLMAVAWGNAPLNGKVHILSRTGTILQTWTATQDNFSRFTGLGTYYDGSMKVYLEEYRGKYQLALYCDDDLYSKSDGAYSIALEVYPTTGSTDIRMWGGDYSFFSNTATTAGHTWLDGTDDMSVDDEATITNIISVGAYVSKKRVTNYQGITNTYDSGLLGDIGYFSSYAIPSLTPDSMPNPWITAPGSVVASAINHYHTTSVDEYSYFSQDYSGDLVVNSSSSPYAVMEGTSMATPVAAGIVAQWLQAARAVGKTLTVNEVKAVMAETAIVDSYVTGTNATHFGHGKIDALAGLRYILGDSIPVDTVPVDTVPVVGGNKYQLVTNESSLAAGDKILIAYVNGDDLFALGTNQKANNREATTDVTLNADGTLTPGENAQIITLEKDGNSFLFNVGNGYLYAASSDKNWLKTETTADANAKASISISGNEATITFQGSNTRNTVRYNPNAQNNAPLFSCYAPSSTTGSLPQIYRQLAITPITALPEALTDEPAVKFFRNGHLYILRGDKLYDALGRRIQ